MGKQIGGPRLFYISKEGGLLLFSGTKIRGGDMIQQDLQYKKSIQES